MDEDEIMDEIIEVDPDESQYHPIVDGMDEEDPSEESDEEESYEEIEINKDQNSETNQNVQPSLQNRTPSGKVHNPEFSFSLIN